MEEFKFPKAELHCHLDGSFRLTTVIDLAKKRSIWLPSYDEDTLKMSCSLNRCSDLYHYLKPGDTDAIKRITYEAIEDKSKNGVAYLELRFSPHLLANSAVEPLLFSKDGGDVTPRDVVDAVCSATSDASAKFDIEVRLILCTISQFPEWSMETAKLCVEFRSMGVVAIDIAGEDTVPGDLFDQRHKDAFHFCKRNKIKRTCHAGENGSAEEVERAINLLDAQRIGHGYHVVDNDSIYAEAKAKQVHFEVCPRSSYLTASVSPDLTKHPAIRFMRDKVNFSLSTDDPGVQMTTIFDEYEIAKKSFGFSLKDIQSLNILALKSSFAEEPVKIRMIEKFERAYESFNLL